MAKKKNENALQYLQMPLPSGGKYSKMTKVAFGGLNKRYTIDSGDLTMESNISTDEYPYLVPSESRNNILSDFSDPLGIFAFDDFIIVIYRDEAVIRVAYVVKGEDGKYTYYHGILKEYDSAEEASEDNEPRCVVQFNKYIQSDDIVNGTYKKHLLIFPDKVSMYMNIVEADGNPENWDDDGLKEQSTSVMYHYQGKYYTIGFVKKEDGDEGYDKNKVSYKRKLYKKSESVKTDEDGNEETITLDGAFFCDGMDVVVKEYRNETPEVDKSGAIIYPPPDTSSHNGWYFNSHTKDVYCWTTYEMARKKENEEISLTEKDGDWVIKGFEKDKNDNFIFDGEMTEGWKVSIPPNVPNIKYATVHSSRLFGVSDDSVYASGFNDYANWNLDTADEYNDSNAWQSKTQSNSKADGNFTGIITFQGHVVCFKRDFMHEIYNTKNPFRIQDIYAEGAIDNRTLQDVDGKLIFVSEDDVKVYTGSNPRIIGHNLNMSKFTYAVSGTDNRNYYLYCEDDKKISYLYVYDTFNDLWSEQSIDERVIGFAHNTNGMYMLCKSGIYQMDTEVFNHSWSFETDLVTNKTVDIKHIKKLQMLVEKPSSSAWFKVYILYDDERLNKDSHLVYDSDAMGKTGKFPVRVKPRKTANYGFKLHIKGYGYVKLYELEMFVEQGGDLYV